LTPLSAPSISLDTTFKKISLEENLNYKLNKEIASLLMKSFQLLGWRTLEYGLLTQADI